MSVVKYFAAAWLAIIFYALSSFFFGGTGLSAYKRLNNSRIEQAENISALRRINDSLNSEKEALSFDADTIEQEAINIGYGRDGETYIHIEGFEGVRRHNAEAGEILRPSEPGALEDETIKIYAIGIFIIAIAIAGFIDIVRFIRKI